MSVAGILAGGFEGYEIEEIELSLAVNGSGGIELIGKLEAGAQAEVDAYLAGREAEFEELRRRQRKDDPEFIRRFDERLATL